MEEMDGLLEEIRQSGELVATEPLADGVQTKTPAIVADPRRGQDRDLRVHRRLVQPPPPALHARLA